MKAFKAICLVVAVSFLLAFIPGCTSKNTTSSTSSSTTGQSKATEKPTDPVTLRLAENQPEDYPTTVGDKEFAKLVEERTKGRVKIQVFAGGQLGQEKAVIEQVQFGGIDFARVSLSPMSEFSPKLNALQMPYLYRDADHMWKVLEGTIGQELLDSLAAKGFHGLCYYDAGARHFYNTKKEAKTVADLKGMKIRVQESKLMMGLVTALSANPQPMAYAEVYSALKTGVIDGAENNFPSYFSSNHYEVAKFLTLDGHTRVPEVVIASKKALEDKKISKEDMDIIKQAAKDSVKAQKAAWAKMEKESEDKVKAAGCKITTLDAKSVEEFQKAMDPLYQEQAKDYMDIITKIRAVK